MTRIIIARHGRTFAPGVPVRRIGGRTDIPLTDEGKEESLALGRWLAIRERPFDHVLTSPLQRTRQTAELIVSCQPSIPVIRCASWLREIDYGPDENQLERDVIKRIGKGALELWETKMVVPEGWLVDAPARIAWWQKLFRKKKGNILVVTSSGAARFALCAIDDAHNTVSIKLRTGSYGVIGVQEGSIIVEGWDIIPSS